MNYRIYLYDAYGKICAGEALLATDDAEALELGAIVFRSVSDACCRYEVWSGIRHLNGPAAMKPYHAPSLVELSDARAIRVLDLEERLASSFACIRTSRALLVEVNILIAARNSGAERRGDEASQGHDNQARDTIIKR
ncbi:MAG: hypothetical protein ACJ8AW_03400 [Rhodopila sp.]